MTDNKIGDKKITDENQSGFSRYTKERATKDAQRVYRSTFAGDMATLGREGGRTEGYPFGSVTPFIIDHTGCPVVQMATMAEHTKNAYANGKASLLLRQVERQHNVNTGWRLAVSGDLTEINDTDDLERVAETYYRAYPEARDYTEVHDFRFFRLTIVAARVIMGFGKISWIEPEDLMIASPFNAAEETRVIKHMNDDHQDAIRHYLRKMGVEVKESTKSPFIVGLNQFGIVVDYFHHLYFVEYNEVANTMPEVKQQLVTMARS